MAARPGVTKGRDIPDKFRFKELMKDKEKSKQYEEQSKAWIQEGMKKDAEKQK